MIGISPCQFSAKKRHPSSNLAQGLVTTLGELLTTLPEIAAGRDIAGMVANER
jgi:hypothetical protein